jgi:hypothetical protein
MRDSRSTTSRPDAGGEEWAIAEAGGPASYFDGSFATEIGLGFGGAATVGFDFFSTACLGGSAWANGAKGAYTKAEATAIE